MGIPSREVAIRGSQDRKGPHFPYLAHFLVWGTIAEPGLDWRR